MLLSLTLATTPHQLNPPSHLIPSHPIILRRRRLAAYLGRRQCRPILSHLTRVPDPSPQSVALPPKHRYCIISLVARRIHVCSCPIILPHPCMLIFTRNLLRCTYMIHSYPWNVWLASDIWGRGDAGIRRKDMFGLVPFDSWQLAARWPGDINPSASDLPILVQSETAMLPPLIYIASRGMLSSCHKFAIGNTRPQLPPNE